MGLRMAKASEEHIDRLRHWMQFNDELCKIDPANEFQWNQFKDDWREDKRFTKIIEHCEDKKGFSWEYYMDYYERHISHIHMRIIFGYEVLLDNVCDPELDYLDYKKEFKSLLESQKSEDDSDRT
jgi:hypothetical protein